MKGFNQVQIKRLSILLLLIGVILALTGCFDKKKENKPQVFSFDRITKAEGLPSEKITCIAPYGEKICAGSNEGLFIFDGVNWEICNKETHNSLGSNLIVGMHFLNGKLWVATDNGACYFDGENFRSIYTGARARAVTGVDEKKYAVGTAFGVFRDGNNSGNSGSNVAASEISCMIYDTKGQLWVGTRLEGMFKMTSSSGTNYKGPGKKIMGSSLIPVPATPASCKLPGNLIKALLPFKEGLAVGTTGGLCLTDFSSYYDVYTAEHQDYFPKDGRIVEEVVPGNSDIPGNKIYALAKTDNNELLFVVTDLGLGILKGKEWLNVDKIIPGLPSDGLNSVAWCKGYLWLGTNEEGVIRIKNLSSLLEDNK